MPATYTRRHQLLLEFSTAPARSFAVLRSNVALLNAGMPQIRNEPLSQLALAAVNHWLELPLLRTCEAVKLLNLERGDQGLDKLDVESELLAPVFRMRNKLLAHRLANLADTDDHVNWYRSNVGTVDAAFDTVMNAANFVAARITEMFEEGRIYGFVRLLPPERGITPQDFTAILRALSSAGLN